VITSHGLCCLIMVFSTLLAYTFQHCSHITTYVA
jgi:hypothetical protein